MRSNFLHHYPFRSKEVQEASDQLYVNERQAIIDCEDLSDAELKKLLDKWAKTLTERHDSAQDPIVSSL
ncbi:MAG: hypothetical protein V7L29_14745 [Nostoc sp.]|uniref:hypothetical protein n=1 Tax=Nostoc sp. TaxID=1180 RepID=UPI002FF06916